MHPNPQTLERFEKTLHGIVALWSDNFDDPEDARRRESDFGSLLAVKGALNRSDVYDDFVSLWASDRPDLTLEALSLRSAWTDLFTEEQKSAARARLSEARARWENRPERRAPTDHETWVFWIDGRPVGLRRNAASDTAPHVTHCEAFAASARTFADSGQFGASFSQRRHYRTCGKCTALKQLHNLVSAIDEEDFRRLRALLRALDICMESPRKTAMMYHGMDDRSWRAIVLACYIGESYDIHTADWVDARAGLADPAFNTFAQSLGDHEFFGLPLSNRVSFVIDSASGDPKHGISLPTDGDLNSEPGVLNAVYMEDLWTDLLGEWPDLPPPNDGVGVFQGDRFLAMAVDAADYDIQLARSGSAPLLSAPTPSITVDSPGIPPKIEKANTHTGRAGYRRAEAEARSTLGDEIYDSLCPDALFNLVEAQYRSFDSGARMGNVIVSGLGTAFELQIKDRVIKPFTDELTLRRRLWSFPWPFKFKGVDRMNLGNITILFAKAEPEFVQFIRSRALDLGD